LVYRGKGACSAPVGGPSTPTLTTMAEGGIGVEEPQAPLAVNGRDVWSTLPDFSRDVNMLALSQNNRCVLHGGFVSKLHGAHKNT